MRGGTIKLGPGARPGNVHLQLSLFTSWNLRRLALLDPASMIRLKKTVISQNNNTPLPLNCKPVSFLKFQVSSVSTTCSKTQ